MGLNVTRAGHGVVDEAGAVLPGRWDGRLCGGRLGRQTCANGVPSWVVKDSASVNW